MADVIQLHPTCTQQQAYTRKPWKKGMRWGNKDWRRSQAEGLY
jgi:hypothetical protein